jgi:hypothetical protein
VLNLVCCKYDQLAVAYLQIWSCPSINPEIKDGWYYFLCFAGLVNQNRGSSMFPLIDYSERVAAKRVRERTPRCKQARRDECQLVSNRPI